MSVQQKHLSQHFARNAPTSLILGSSEYLLPKSLTFNKVKLNPAMGIHWFYCYSGWPMLTEEITCSETPGSRPQLESVRTKFLVGYTVIQVSIRFYSFSDRWSVYPGLRVTTQVTRFVLPNFCSSQAFHFSHLKGRRKPPGALHMLADPWSDPGLARIQKSNTEVVWQSFAKSGKYLRNMNRTSLLEPQCQERQCCLV